MKAKSQPSALEEMRYALGLVLVGIRNGHIKCKPLVQESADGKSMDMVSIESIVAAAYARTGAE